MSEKTVVKCDVCGCDEQREADRDAYGWSHIEVNGAYFETEWEYDMCPDCTQKYIAAVVERSGDK